MSKRSSGCLYASHGRTGQADATRGPGIAPGPLVRAGMLSIRVSRRFVAVAPCGGKLVEPRAEREPSASRAPPVRRRGHAHHHDAIGRVRLARRRGAGARRRARARRPSRQRGPAPRPARAAGTGWTPLDACGARRRRSTIATLRVDDGRGEHLPCNGSRDARSPHDRSATAERAARAARRGTQAAPGCIRHRAGRRLPAPNPSANPAGTTWKGGRIVRTTVRTHAYRAAPRGAGSVRRMGLADRGRDDVLVPRTARPSSIHFSRAPRAVEV